MKGPRSLTALPPKDWNYKLDEPHKMVQKWFRFAPADLISAKAPGGIQNERIWRPTTFHSQQASEGVI